jgi:hypothetical protein
MKNYKLLNKEGYPDDLIKGDIYPANRISNMKSVEELAIEFPQDWEFVTEKKLDFEVGDWVCANGKNHTANNKSFPENVPFVIGEIKIAHSLEYYHIIVDKQACPNYPGHTTNDDSIRHCTVDELNKFSNSEFRLPKYWKIQLKTPEHIEVVGGWFDDNSDTDMYGTKSIIGDNVQGWLSNSFGWGQNGCATEITFEQFKKYVLKEPEFVLPEKWYIAITPYNSKVINDWKIKQEYHSPIGEHTKYVSENGGSYLSKAFFGSYTKITFEQFKKYVLKEPEFVLPEFVLPEKWCVKDCAEVSQYAKNKWGCRNIVYDRIYHEGKTRYNNEYTFIESVEEGFTLLSLEDFKKYVLKKENKMEKKLIGYKLKSDCIKYADAVLKLEGNRYIGQGIKTNCILDITSTESVEALKNFGVLDLWFEEVYETVKTLPTINGYKGQKVDANSVKYGCVTIRVSDLRDIASVEQIASTRTITSIKLSSDVDITMEQIKEIIDYFKK